MLRAQPAGDRRGAPSDRPRGRRRQRRPAPGSTSQRGRQGHIDQVEYIIQMPAEVRRPPKSAAELGLHPKNRSTSSWSPWGARGRQASTSGVLPVSVAAYLLVSFLSWAEFSGRRRRVSACPGPTTTAPRPFTVAVPLRRRRSGRNRSPFDASICLILRRHRHQLCPCTIATTTPQAFTVASPSGDITQPGSSPPASGRRVRGATRPMSARFRVGGFVLRSVQPLVPRVCLSVSLAEPAPSGSTGTARRCRGLLHQPPPRRGSRPSSSFQTPAATGIPRWPPTTARVRERLVALDVGHPQLIAAGGGTCQPRLTRSGCRGRGLVAAGRNNAGDAFPRTAPPIPGDLHQPGHLVPTEDDGRRRRATCPNFRAP